MAKIKKLKKDDENDGSLESQYKDIIKKYGNVIISGSKLLESRKDYKTIHLSPIVDIALGGGIKEGSWVILSGKQKSGKEQPISSLVYTPSGPKTMGEIEIGDIVSTPDGETANVIGVYPQGLKDVYEITFNDKTTVRCGLEHLWRVKENKKNREPQILKLADFKDDLKTFNRESVDKWQVELTSPVCFTEQELPIDPYLLGALLGDGSFRGGAIRFSNIDVELLLNISNMLQVHGCKLYHSRGCDYYIVKINKKLKNKTNNVLKIIKDLNLHGLLSKDKFIPKEFIYSSIETRKELIRGLFDTDAHNHNGMYIEYSTVSKQLMDGVEEICQSLGYKVVCRKRKTKCNEKEFESYRICIHGNNIGDLFKIQRKAFGVRKKGKIFRTISDVKYIGKQESKCIEIDSESHLYLTDNFTPTHNTVTAMQLAYNCQQEGRPIIYINSEGRLKDMNFEIPGLDPEKMIIVTSENEPLSAEAFLEITYKLVSSKENEGCLCIIDSVSSLIPAKDLEEEVSGMIRPGLPKILSNFTKKMGQIVPNQKATMIMITHMITNTSGYGKHMNADSGVKIQYQADTNMEVKEVKAWVQGDTQIGQAVTWKILCSSMGPPGGECQSWIKYGHGIDKVQEIIIMGQEAGLISGTTWLTCNFLFSVPALLKEINPDLPLKADGTYEKPDDAVKLCKFQGQEKLYNYIRSEPKAFNLLEQNIRTMLS